MVGDIPTHDVQGWAKEFLDFIAAKYPAIPKEIAEKRELVRFPQGQPEQGHRRVQHLVPAERAEAVVRGARRLAEEGAAVALVARRRDRLETLAAVIASQRGRAAAIEADPHRKPQAQEAVDPAVAELGRLDILVKSAGAPFRLH